MKYFYFISLAFLVSLLFVFTNLNPEIIVLDLFFLKIEGVSVGFSIVFAVLLGAIISLILQIPRLFKKNLKTSSPKESDTT